MLSLDANSFALKTLLLSASSYLGISITSAPSISLSTRSLSLSAPSVPFRPVPCLSKSCLGKEAFLICVFTCKEWTLANISPLFKKGDRSLACNYRPVSLTCVPCKLLEHIVCSNIMAHLDETSIRQTTCIQEVA